MRANRASTTARMVAFWRALADGGATTVPGFHDPHAAALLPRPYQLAAKAFLKLIQSRPADKRALVVDGFDVMPIRVAVIDAEMLAAVAAGCRQIVILGAGFDTRAYRFAELEGATLFEVDHPATQAEKRRRAAALPPPRARVVWTAVDFAHDDLATALAAAGHDAEAATVWLWEGVVMYLDDDAVRATLSVVKARSAPGSKLVLHYHEPGPSSLGNAGRRRLFAWLGEPQIGVRSREAMTRLVETAGLAIEADLGIAEQAAKVGAVVPRRGMAKISRILVARSD